MIVPIRNRRLAAAAAGPAVLFVCLFFGPLAGAQRLPVRFYSSAEGLASSAITHVAHDSQGYLWFSTRDGLSRFDGVDFVNYRLPDIDTSQTFWYFLETRDGTCWFATGAGLFRASRTQVAAPRPATNAGFGNTRVLNAKPAAKFSFTVMHEDRQGRIWGGGSRLFVIDEPMAEQIEPREVPVPGLSRTTVFGIAESEDGSIWAAVLDGAVRIMPDGRAVVYRIPRRAPGDEAFAIETDTAGRVWLGQTREGFVFSPESADEISAEQTERTFEEVISVELTTAGNLNLPEDPRTLLRISDSKPPERNNDPAALQRLAGFTALLADKQGAIWLAAGKSLYKFEGNTYNRIGGEDTLTGTTRALVEDNEGNIWAGTNGGAIQLINDGFITYSQADGLDEPQIAAIFETANGDLIASHGLWLVSRIGNSGAETFRLKMPPETGYAWTSIPLMAEPKGGFYVLAREGLFYIGPGGSFVEAITSPPVAVEGQTGKLFYRHYTAKDGSVWLSTRGTAEQNGLYRINPISGQIEDKTATEGFPKGKAPASFAETPNGEMWIGFYGAPGLARYSNGRFREYLEGDGVPRGAILALHTDAAGRLWVGSNTDGLSRLEDESGNNLRFKRFTENDGLASNNVRSITEDLLGNIYAGTVRGVDRISPGSGRVRHYSTRDGLAADFINVSYRDRSGTLWFGTPNGLSALKPQQDKTGREPNVHIDSLEIAGEAYSISEFGQASVSGLDLASSQSNIRIGVSAVGAGLRYQYRLEGGQQAEWSAPETRRTFDFANLAPAAYRFEVRAIGPGGEVSSVPAAVSFTIAPPFYRAWWFMVLAALIVAGGVFALDRYRVRKTRQVQSAYNELRRSERERREAALALQKSREERLAELEQVRTRIATDLHDDIGSSLTQIAVLSQAAQGRAAERDEKLAGPLIRIAEVSVELVNAMSDIVWAINPKRDRLRDLVQRMRRFAADVLTAKGIRFGFDAPDIESKVTMGANIRREVFAIYKEAVSNIAKHSRGDRAEIALSVSGETLRMQISDNGRGFDAQEMIHLSQPPDTAGGNGLKNMERRGKELGGRCEVISFPGGGTSVVLEVPVHGQFEPSGNDNGPSSRMAGETDGE